MQTSMRSDAHRLKRQLVCGIFMHKVLLASVRKAYPDVFLYVITVLPPCCPLTAGLDNQVPSPLISKQVILERATDRAFLSPVLRALLHPADPNLIERC